MKIINPIPFDAYFEYAFEGKISTLYDNENLLIFLSRTKTSANSKNISLDKFLSHYLTGANLFIWKKDCQIPFDPHSRHSIYPETIPVDYLNTVIEFKVKSQPIQVIGINGDEITFIGTNKIVKTIHLFKDITLNHMY